VSATLIAAPTAASLAREHPEWSGWLAVLDVTAHEAANRAWEDVAVRDTRGAGAMLAGVTLRVDRGLAEGWVRRLFSAAGADGLREGGARSDALAVLEAAVNLDASRFEHLALAAGAPVEPFSAVAPLAAMPLLEAYARRQTAGNASGAFCAVCGAWPALAEARGLEGERRLRCARCGGDWRTQWLSCSFCGNDDHTRLTSLVAEHTGERRKVDACRDCTGYVKTVTTLSAADAPTLRLLDLATVDLDVAALERGFTRPAGLGHALNVTVAERPTMRRFWRR
jgi:FdhE protein